MRKNDSVPSLTIEEFKLIDEALLAYGLEDEEYHPLINKIQKLLYGRETDKVVPSVIEQAKIILAEYPSIVYCANAKGLKTLEEGKSYHCKFLIIMYKYRSLGSIVYSLKKTSNLKSADFVEIYDERFKVPRRYSAKRFKEFGI